MKLRKKLALKLLTWAGKLSPECDVRGMSFSFHFKDHTGIVFDHGTSTGCPMYYMRADYDKAHQYSDQELLAAGCMPQVNFGDDIGEQP